MDICELIDLNSGDCIQRFQRLLHGIKHLIKRAEIIPGREKNPVTDDAETSGCCAVQQD